MDSISVRKMTFEFPEDMELVFLENDPDLSIYFLGSWMSLPYLEPYLIKNVRRAADEITDAALAERIKLFCAQEGVHFREHAKANDVIRAAHPQFVVMKELEEELRAEYERFTETKSLRWNLAYAEAFESFTTAGAITQFEMRIFDNMVAPLGDLFAWHVMEELEHRTVAYEALEAVEPSYWYRVLVGTRCLMHYLRWSFKLAGAMAKAAPEIMKQPIGKAEKKRRNKLRRTLLLRTFPRTLRVFSPRYHPRDLALPDSFYEVQSKYDEIVAGS
ncbi:metal-dependent hydrolase [Nocardia sp. FBN12]|uniref:metal-dependent hydrolase n=1 Tax=Nocardia sp. FBN12 TaxID=3419766 RepID=UPI003CFDF87A